jgi:hypothetical protein
MYNKTMDFEYLDKYFNENDEPDKNIFGKITSSEELHYIADRHNWDNGITVLKWIVVNELCSEATALMIFWRAQPFDYVEYNYNARKIKSGNIDIFNLIKTIIENYKNGFYKKTSIKYNPKNDMPENDIPEIMFEETNGEEPYIYYDEKEVNLWFGEYLENQIEKCESSIDLYNIIYLLEYKSLADNYEKILIHKHCDRGIALFIFWKLKKSSYVFDESKIIGKIIQNEYPEIIKYDPGENIKNIKWEIPEIMKNEIK